MRLIDAASASSKVYTRRYFFEIMDLIKIRNRGLAEAGACEHLDEGLAGRRHGAYSY
jgi:hypothetical protein